MAKSQIKPSLGNLSKKSSDRLLVYQCRTISLAISILTSYYWLFSNCSLNHNFWMGHVACRPSQYKDASHQYRDSYFKDKMVSRLSYIYDGNFHTWKDCLYIKTGLLCPLLGLLSWYPVTQSNAICLWHHWPILQRKFTQISLYRHWILMVV